jgi:hypothetical protein
MEKEDQKHAEQYLHDVEKLDCNNLGIMQFRTLITLGL